MSISINPLTGIYKITNEINGKYYIGSSINIKKRWGEHRRSLNHGDHCSRYLQRSWNKHGRKWFNFSVVLICEPSDRLEYEQWFLDNYSCNYNMSKEVTSGMGGRHHTQETKDRIRRHKLGIKLTKEHRKKISIALSGMGNGFYGKTHIQEAKVKMSKAHKGLPSPNKGKKMSLASKEQMIKNRTGKCVGKEHWATKDLINIYTGDIYHSIVEAADKIGIKRTTLNAVLSGQTKTNKYGIVYL